LRSRSRLALDFLRQTLYLRLANRLRWCAHTGLPLRLLGNLRANLLRVRNAAPASVNSRRLNLPRDFRGRNPRGRHLHNRRVDDEIVAAALCALEFRLLLPLQVQLRDAIIAPL